MNRIELGELLLLLVRSRKLRQDEAVDIVARYDRGELKDSQLPTPLADTPLGMTRPEFDDTLETVAELLPPEVAKKFRASIPDAPILTEDTTFTITSEVNGVRRSVDVSSVEDIVDQFTRFSEALPPSPAEIGQRPELPEDYLKERQRYIDGGPPYKPDGRTKADAMDFGNQELQQLADEHNMTQAEVEDLFWDKVERYTKDKPVRSRHSVTTAYKIVAEGRFKTQFETTSSQGAFDNDYRREAEALGFGVPENIDPRFRPVYGYYESPGTSGMGGSVSDYGGVEFVFKLSSRNRTTITFGDSLESIVQGFTVGVPVDNFTNAGLADMNLEDFIFGSSVESYIEAQIHGGVTLDDIEEVRFHEQDIHDPGDLHNSSHLMQLFEDLDIPTVWVTRDEEDNSWQDVDDIRDEFDDDAPHFTSDGTLTSSSEFDAEGLRRGPDYTKIPAALELWHKVKAERVPPWAFIDAYGSAAAFQMRKFDEDQERLRAADARATDVTGFFEGKPLDPKMIDDYNAYLKNPTEDVYNRFQVKWGALEIGRAARWVNANPPLPPSAIPSSPRLDRAVLGPPARVTVPKLGVDMTMPARGPTVELTRKGDGPLIRAPSAVPTEVRLFLRERLRNHFRADYERSVRGHTDTLIGTGNVPVWHKNMTREQRAYIGRQYTAGVGRALNSVEIERVNARAMTQQAFLYRFAGEIAAHNLAGRPYSAEYLQARASQYQGVGWGMWFRGNEQVETRGDGWVCDYIARDDENTCPACLAAEAGGPYLPETGPFPGEDCHAHGRCRCIRRARYDLNAWKRLMNKTGTPDAGTLTETPQQAAERQRKASALADVAAGALQGRRQAEAAAQAERLRVEAERAQAEAEAAALAAQRAAEAEAEAEHLRQLELAEEERLRQLDEEEEGRVPQPIDVIRPDLYDILDNVEGIDEDTDWQDVRDQRTWRRPGLEAQLLYNEIDRLMTENVVPAVNVPLGTHSIAAAEDMAGFIFDGKMFRYAQNPEARQAVIRMIVDMYAADKLGLHVPQKLWDAQDTIYVTNSLNKDDAYWQERYNNPAHRSAATAGDGSIMVYYSNVVSAESLVHEMGHNLAFKLYGKTDPRFIQKLENGQYVTRESDWLSLTENEPAVSRYGENSPAEDFAETAKRYFENQTATTLSPNVEKHPLEDTHPDHYFAFESLLDGRSDQENIIRRQVTLRSDLAPTEPVRTEDLRDVLGYGPLPGDVRRAQRAGEVAIQRAADDRGTDPDDLAEQLLSQVEALTTGPVRMRHNDRNALLILESGRFKTQFETGKSGGELDTDLRQIAEFWGMGVPHDIDKTKRPLYGYFDVPNHRAAEYGAVDFLLRDDVKDRTTIFLGDSLDDFAHQAAVGTDIRNLDETLFTDENIKSLLENGTVPKYIEAQVHQGVSLADVAQVQLHWNGTNEARLHPVADAYRQAGFDVTWVHVASGDLVDVYGTAPLSEVEAERKRLILDGRVPLKFTEDETLLRDLQAQLALATTAKDRSALKRKIAKVEKRLDEADAARARMDTARRMMIEMTGGSLPTEVLERMLQGMAGKNYLPPKPKLPFKPAKDDAPVYHRNVETVRPELFEMLDATIKRATEDQLRDIKSKIGIDSNNASALHTALRSELNNWLDAQPVDLFMSSGEGHDLGDVRQFQRVYIEGTEFAWEGAASRYALIDSVIDLYVNDLLGFKIPLTLWNSNVATMFAGTESPANAYWEQQYNMPGFISSATGGNGTIMVYGGRPLTADSFMHESAHNFAYNVYGSPHPDKLFDAVANVEYDSGWKVGIAGELPISLYGTKSSAEDFAESYEAYYRNPDYLESKAPQRHQLVTDMLRGRGDAAELDSIPLFGPRPLEPTPVETPEPGPPEFLGTIDITTRGGDAEQVARQWREVLHLDVETELASIMSVNYKGIHTEMSVQKSISGNTFTANAMFSAIVKGRSENVGRLTRTFHIETDRSVPGGKYVRIHHDYLEFNDEWTSFGFADDLYKKQLNMYKQKGYHFVDIYANITVGIYAWARKGFQYEDGASTAQMYTERFIRWAKKLGFSEPDAGWPVFKNPQDVANYKMPGATVDSKRLSLSRTIKQGIYELGKAFMLDNNGHGSWNGVFYLNPETPYVFSEAPAIIEIPDRVQTYFDRILIGEWTAERFISLYGRDMYDELVRRDRAAGLAGQRYMIGTEVVRVSDDAIHDFGYVTSGVWDEVDFVSNYGQDVYQVLNDRFMRGEPLRSEIETPESRALAEAVRRDMQIMSVGQAISWQDVLAGRITVQEFIEAFGQPAYDRLAARDNLFFLRATDADRADWAAVEAGTLPLGTFIHRHGNEMYQAFLRASEATIPAAAPHIGGVLEFHAGRRVNEYMDMRTGLMRRETFVQNWGEAALISLDTGYREMVESGRWEEAQWIRERRNDPAPAVDVISDARMAELRSTRDEGMREDFDRIDNGEDDEMSAETFVQMYSQAEFDRLLAEKEGIPHQVASRRPDEDPAVTRLHARMDAIDTVRSGLLPSHMTSILRNWDDYRAGRDMNRESFIDLNGQDVFDALAAADGITAETRPSLSTDAIRSWDLFRRGSISEESFIDRHGEAVFQLALRSINPAILEDWQRVQMRRIDEMMFIDLHGNTILDALRRRDYEQGRADVAAREAARVRTTGTFLQAVRGEVDTFRLNTIPPDIASSWRLLQQRDISEAVFVQRHGNVVLDTLRAQEGPRTTGPDTTPRVAITSAMSTAWANYQGGFIRDYEFIQSFGDEAFRELTRLDNLGVVIQQIVRPDLTHTGTVAPIITPEMIRHWNRLVQNMQNEDLYDTLEGQFVNNFGSRVLDYLSERTARGLQSYATDDTSAEAQRSREADRPVETPRATTLPARSDNRYTHEVMRDWRLYTLNEMTEAEFIRRYDESIFAQLQDARHFMDGPKSRQAQSDWIGFRSGTVSESQLRNRYGRAVIAHMFVTAGSNSLRDWSRYTRGLLVHDEIVGRIGQPFFDYLYSLQPSATTPTAPAAPATPIVPVIPLPPPRRTVVPFGPNIMRDWKLYLDGQMTRNDFIAQYRRTVFDRLQDARDLLAGPKGARIIDVFTRFRTGDLEATRLLEKLGPHVVAHLFATQTPHILANWASYQAGDLESRVFIRNAGQNVFDYLTGLQPGTPTASVSGPDAVIGARALSAFALLQSGNGTEAMFIEVYGQDVFDELTRRAAADIPAGPSALVVNRRLAYIAEVRPDWALDQRRAAADQWQLFRQGEREDWEFVERYNEDVYNALAEADGLRDFVPLELDFSSLDDDPDFVDVDFDDDFSDLPDIRPEREVELLEAIDRAVSGADTDLQQSILDLWNQFRRGDLTAQEFVDTFSEEMYDALADIEGIPSWSDIMDAEDELRDQMRGEDDGPLPPSPVEEPLPPSPVEDGRTFFPPEDRVTGIRAANEQHLREFDREAASTAQAVLDQHARQGIPSIRMSSFALGQMLTDGRYKSSFETMSGAGAEQGLVNRAIGEEFGLGVPQDVDPTQRPVYGILKLTQDDIGIESQYGDIEVELRPDVKLRSTMTLGDSHVGMSSERVVATPVSAPSFEGVAGHSVVMSYVSGDSTHEEFRSNDYVEIQIQGGIRLADIARVTTRNDPTFGGHFLALQSLGIDVAIRETLNPFQLARLEREGQPFLRSPAEPLPPSPVELEPRPVVKVTYKPLVRTTKAAEATIDESLKLWSKAFGKSPTVLARTAINKIKEYVTDQPVRIRSYPGEAQQILKAGRFKSQFETGISGGEYDPDMRANAEHLGMGVPKAINPKKRPIYGYYQTPDVNVDVSMYGNIEWQLNPDLKKRTTVTMGDSLDNMDSGNRVAVPATRINKLVLGANDETRSLVEKGDVVEGYIEAQVHGGVTIQDVVGVRIFMGPRDTQQTYRPLAYMLRKEGIPITWVNEATGAETPDTVTPEVPAIVPPRDFAGEALARLDAAAALPEGPIGWDAIGYKPHADTIKEAIERAQKTFELVAPRARKTPAEVRTLAYKFVRKYTEGVGPGHRTTGAAALKILDNGRFMHSMEHHPTSFMDGAYRSAENRGLGVPRDISVKERPIYATYWTPDDRSEDYGPVEFVFKPEVAARTTITLEDSFEAMTRDGRVGVPVAQIDDSLFMDQSSVGAMVIGNKLIQYIEAQIHGGVSLADVAGVRLYIDQRPGHENWFTDVAQRAEAAGLDVTYYDDVTRQPITPPLPPSPIESPIPYQPDPVFVTRITEVARKIIVWLADTQKASVAEVEAKLMTTLKGHVERKPVSIRVTGTAATLIQKTGRFLTQFESGTSSGSFDVNARAEAEDIGLGVPKDIDVAMRPVYGYYDTPGHKADQYGPIEYKLKPEIAERTTVTVGDSLGPFTNLMMVGVPATQLSKTAFTLSNEAKAMYLTGNPARYIEAQIHGGVQLSDVAEIVVHYSNFHDADIRVMLDAYRGSGIKITLVDDDRHGIRPDTLAELTRKIEIASKYDPVVAAAPPVIPPRPLSDYDKNRLKELAKKEKKTPDLMTWDETSILRHLRERQAALDSLDAPLPPSPMEEPLPPTTVEDLSPELYNAHPNPELLLVLRERKHAEQDNTHLETPERLEAIANVNKRLVDVPVSIAISPASLEKVLESGRFKTQFETGTSGGYLSTTKRATFEFQRMGVRRDIVDEARPIYGYMQLSGIAGANSTLEQYGKVVVNLKPHVRKRTTVTGGDSMDNDLPGSPLENKDGKPDLQSSSFRSIIGRRESIYPPDSKYYDPPNSFETDIDWAHSEENSSDYIEAQIWGGVAVEDIDSVYDYGNKLSKPVRDQLTALGIKVVRAKKVRNFKRESDKAEDAFFAEWRAKMTPGMRNGVFDVPGFKEASVEFEQSMRKLKLEIFVQRRDEMGLMTLSSAR